MAVSMGVPILTVLGVEVLLIYLIFHSSSWIRQPKNSAVILILMTILIAPLHVYASIQLSAYSSGSLFPVSYNYWEDSVELEVDETYNSEILSNYYTQTDVYISIIVTEPDVAIRPQVSFYIVDMNRMLDSKHYEGNYSDHLVHFRLPYLFSDFPFVPAWWSIVLENSLYDEAITVALRVSSGQYEDSGYVASIWIQSIYTLPILVFATSGATIIGLQINQRMKMNRNTDP